MDSVQPSYSSIEFWTDASEPLNINLSDTISVDIDKGTAGIQRIYTGTISDVGISLDAYGAIGSVARYSITAVDALALLNKKVVGIAGYPADLDGVRILKILTDAFTAEWQDVSPFETWIQVPNTVTWASYDGVNLALLNALPASIDTGQFNLSAYAAAETNALSLAQEAAQSGRGTLSATNQGGITYDDSVARLAFTELTLTANDLLAAGLTTAAQWAEIVNDVEVTYTGGKAVARDLDSIILYGQMSGSRATTLSQLSQANLQAGQFLTSRSYPRTYPDTLTIPLHSPTVLDATRDTLANVYIGLPVNTSALPAVFGTNFEGYVEGFNWQITKYTAFLTLVCSSRAETYPSPVWLQIPLTTTWASYTPATTEWIDL